MPIYEYQCEQCGKRTENLQRASDPPLAACPACGGRVKKLPSAPAVQFKGSGWYVTDYGGKRDSARSNGKGKEKGKSSGTETAKPSEGKSESSSPAPASSGSE